tara:strand:- start:147 stop:599 length:453 start_codon:yes stop_codon:yes gene_type:complete
MELSEFIYKRRSLKRTLDTLELKKRTKIIDYIDSLEDEVLRLSRPKKKVRELPESEGIVEITPLQTEMFEKPHITDNWKYDKNELELNVALHLKKLDTEVGERPNMRKIYCVGDVHWMETTYPNLYRKQMQNAYNRMSVKESWNKNKLNN